MIELWADEEEWWDEKLEYLKPEYWVDEDPREKEDDDGECDGSD